MRKKDSRQFLRAFCMAHAVHTFRHLFLRPILTEPGSVLRLWGHSTEKYKHIPAFTGLAFSEENLSWRHQN